jgi:hypothetical protein
LIRVKKNVPQVQLEEDTHTEQVAKEYLVIEQGTQGLVASQRICRLRGRQHLLLSRRLLE